MRAPTQPHRIKPDPNPEGPETHPLLALSLATGLAAVTGLLADWPAAVTVFTLAVGLFTARTGAGGRL
ncbi:hypothetical protein [Nocardia grenadensis]